MLQTATDQRKLYRHARFSRVLVLLCGEVGFVDYAAIREACRFAMLDEAGLLGEVPTISEEELVAQAHRFSDPHTQGWLLPWDGRDPPLQLPAGRDAHECLDAIMCTARTAELQPDPRVLGAQLPAVQSDDVDSLYADINACDLAGSRMTALHTIVADEGRGASSRSVLRSTAFLMLAHGDPGCRGGTGLSAIDYALQGGASKPVLALLCAVFSRGCAALAGDSAVVQSDTWVCPHCLSGNPSSCEARCAFCDTAVDPEVLRCSVGHGYLRGARASADPPVDPASLHEALGLLGEPLRSRLALMLDVNTLSVCARAPPTPLTRGEIFREVDSELWQFARRTVGQRRLAIKELIVRWHPSRVPPLEADVAVGVFSMICQRRASILHR